MNLTLPKAKTDSGRKYKVSITQANPSGQDCYIDDNNEYKSSCSICFLQLY